MKNPIVCLVFISCFFCVISPIWANTDVGKTITKNTTWTKEGSPYMVTENVTILQGVTLTIKEGCTILFSQKTQMFVEGNLEAKGDANNPIRFAGKGNASWNGLFFTKTCNDYNPSTKKGVHFDYCIFKGSYASMDALLHAKGCAFSLSNCQVESCNSAIQIERQSRLWLKHSTIKNCDRAITIHNTSLAEVSHNNFLNCNSILLGGTTKFQYNTLTRFTGAGRHSGLIVWMLGGGKITISYNDFQKFEGCVLKIYKLTHRSTVKIEKNNFRNNLINLKLSCQYYNIGNVDISYNNFYNYRNYHVQVYGRCETSNPVIVPIGRNYWGDSSLEDLKRATADHSQDPTLRIVIQYDTPLEEAIELK